MNQVETNMMPARVPKALARRREMRKQILDHNAASARCKGVASCEARVIGCHNYIMVSFMVVIRSPEYSQYRAIVQL